MQKFISILIGGLFLIGCVSANVKLSKLESIPIEIGMKREKVEEMVAQALGIANEYSPYGNNLTGGVVQYSEASKVLEITYNNGVPAPWVINQDGVAEHYQPVDETVQSFRFYKK